MILVKVPLRISFAGGSTDIPEYYRNNKYGAVCSMAINKYIYIAVRDLPDLFPFKYVLGYSKTELTNEISQIQHPIIKEALRMLDTKSLDFTSMADIPAGTGMGSSSSFTVGLLHSLNLLQGKFLTKEELAKDACDLEINKLGEPIGKQDQYAAAYGGLNHIRFNADESVDVSPIVLDPEREDLFMTHLRLYYLGTQNRSASAIIKSQKKHGVELHALKHLADTCVDVFTQGGPDDLGHLLHQGWEYKKALSDKISSPEIDSLYNLALAQGAYGGKLLGAGGSGFLLICAPPDAKIDLGLKQIDFKPDYIGVASFYV
jgi:D-glycero-alpha-D-manno-heptose-7-phosphate kinase